MKKKESDKFNKYPEYSISQMVSDWSILPHNSFFKKYYSKIEISAWEMWINNTINKAWSEDLRPEFIKNWGERMLDFNFDEMRNFYQRNDMSMFDEDIRKFISFLAGDGFFTKNEITFEEWINMQNFPNPKKDEKQDVSIKEALTYDGGMNYIRMQLINMPWWR